MSPVHVALGLGLVAPPRSPVASAPASGMVRTLAAALGSFTVLICVVPVLQLFDEGVHLITRMPVDATAIRVAGETLWWGAQLLVVSGGLWLLAGPLSALRTTLHAPAVMRRARAFWRLRRGAEPAEVFAALIDESGGPRLSDVEGFLAWARREQWPLRWRVLRLWVRTAQTAVDEAVRGQQREVVLGGERVRTLEAADRLQRIARALWPR